MKRPVRVETPIHPINPIHSWEKLPEYMDTQRFARHLGYIFASLPRARRRALEVPLTRVTQGISMTICALNIEGEGEGADQVRAHAERTMRPLAIEGIEILRSALIELRVAKTGSAWDIAKGLDLLESVERRLRPAA